MEFSKNATIAAPLKYLSNFGRSLEMPLVNCKVELKLKWTKYCVLAAAGAGNVDANSNNIIVTIKDTRFYVPVVTLSAKDNQKLSNLLSKRFDWSVYCNELKPKSENKNRANKYRYFLESNFVEVNGLFVLVYTNQDVSSEIFKTIRYCLPKCMVKNYNVIINGKNFYDQAIDSDIKLYEENKKLTTGQSEDYIIRCLLDYDFIKNHNRLTATDLKRQKELDIDTKAIQQIELVGQLKKLNANDNATNEAGNDQSMFILTILEKNKETRLKFSQGSVIVL